MMCSTISHIEVLKMLVVALALSSLLPGTSEAQSDEMYIHPNQGQSQEQEDKDRSDCHNLAVEQSGFDPGKVYPKNPMYLDPQPYPQSRRPVLRSAGRGAAMGAVGGAVAGDAGKGAAAGAAFGGMAGALRRRDERRQAKVDQKRMLMSKNASRTADYQRAMNSCLQQRGYSVN